MKSQNLIIGLVILVGVAGYLAWDIYQIHQSIKYASSLAPGLRFSQSVGNDKVKAEVIAMLADMKVHRYGEWPLGPVVLSSERGNPFAAK